LGYLISRLTLGFIFEMGVPEGGKKSLEWSNLALGAGLNIFEISTLGQPFEVLKTHLAANRNDTLVECVKKTYGRGGLVGFYQGLIPWAWLEAATKGAVLLFTASELEYFFNKKVGCSSGASGILAGMGGGVAQAYLTMGISTFMKTVEITRHKNVPGQKEVGTIQLAYQIFQKEGIRGINKGVNAVALRQMTNWGSRLGFSRIGENLIRKTKNDPEGKLTAGEKITAATIGGGLACWNQPIEVIRVELQSQVKTPGRPEKMTIIQCARWIYGSHGLKGFFRGVLPRIGLGAWQTVCMVAFGDMLKQKLQEHNEKKKMRK
jgi:hypothetical protein